MTERFLSDRASVPDLPIRSRSVDRLPMTERVLTDFHSDRVCESPMSLRSASKSPLREKRGRTVVSVRTRHVSRSPMRDLNGMDKPPMGSTLRDSPSSLVRGDLVSKCDENAVLERGATDRHFNKEEDRKLGLPDHEHARQPNVNYPGRRRSWRDQLGDEVEQISERRESVSDSEHGMTSEGSTDDLIHGVDLNKETMHRPLRYKADNFRGYANGRVCVEQWVLGRGGLGAEHDRFSASSSVGDGPSDYRSDLVYGYDDQMHNFVNLRGHASIQNLELECAQLLLKYKELKDQLNGLDNTRLSTPGLYHRPNDFSEAESWRSGQVSLRQLAPDKSVRRRPHFNHVPDDNMEDLYNYHSPLYDDPVPGQIARWPQNTRQHQFLKRPAPSHIPGRSLDFDQDSLRSYDNVIPRHTPGRSLDFDHDPINSYLDEANYHHLVCSCSLCAVRDWEREHLPNSSTNRISVHSAPYQRSNHSMNADRHVPWVYNPRMAQTNPRERPSHLVHQHPRTVVPAGNKRFCYPIAGGSPFILCCKCFRLLNLPRKLMQSQLQCGACSAAMSFDSEKRSFVPLPSQQKLNSVGSFSIFGKVLKGPRPKHRREMTATSTILGSYDFDAAQCSFQSIDSEPSVASKGQRLSSSSADNIYRLSSSSSHNSRSSKEDSASDNASVQSILLTSAEKPLINMVRPPIGSPLRDHFDYSNCFRKLEVEAKINNVEENKVLEKDALVEGSSSNVTISREAEVHSQETSSTAATEKVEEDKTRNTKDKHSPIASFMKWGFASKSVRPPPGRVEVYVNGQLIPQRGVKRAEKFAGPIQPGEYWYDSKAGFWGVMGCECLGIIPPFIQEFSFPLPENCSGGNTAVYVNGRELPKKDLDLLASRGLPMTSNKRYIIDISGKVVEEGSRQFVVNLGRLAPTVERNRCGYGMRDPKNLE